MDPTPEDLTNISKDRVMNSENETVVQNHEKCGNQKNFNNASQVQIEEPNITEKSKQTDDCGTLLIGRSNDMITEAVNVLEKRMMERVNQVKFLG